MSLVWKDPPPSKTFGKLAGEIAELKAHPGVWALVRESTHRSAGISWERHGCETTLRKNPDGTWQVYARWPEQDA